jgi:hypothetical protein
VKAKFSAADVADAASSPGETAPQVSRKVKAVSSSPEEPEEKPKKKMKGVLGPELLGSSDAETILDPGKIGAALLGKDMSVENQAKKTQGPISIGIALGADDSYKMPGLVVPYPLSQLILRGICSIHMTLPRNSPQYQALFSRSLRAAGWVWLIEGHAKSRNLPKATLYDLQSAVPADVFGKLPSRPVHSQIVGAVQFGDEVRYHTREQFQADFHRHFIPVDHMGGWPEKTELKVGWRLQEFASVASPYSLQGQKVKLLLSIRHVRYMCIECVQHDKITRCLVSTYISDC